MWLKSCRNVVGKQGLCSGTVTFPGNLKGAVAL